MRVAAEDAGGIADPHLVEHPGRHLGRLGREHVGLGAIDLAQLGADLQRRVERGAGALGDECDAPPPPAPERPLSRSEEVVPGEQDPPALDAAGAGQVAHQRQRERRLPRPGLPDEPVRLAALDPERHVGESTQPPAPADVRDGQPGDVECRRPLLGRRHCSILSRSPSAIVVVATTSVASASAGKSTIHGAVWRNTLPSATERPQSGEGCWIPSPRKERVAAAKMAAASRVVRLGDDQGGEVRQDLRDHDVGSGVAAQARGLHVFLAALAANRGANGSRCQRRQDEGDDDDEMQPGDAGDGQREDGAHDEREGEQRIDDTHEHVVPHAPEVAGDQSDRDADGDREERGDRCHDQHRRRSREDPGEHIPTEIVRAEPVLGRRPLERPVGRDRLRVVWREGGPGDRVDDPEEQHGDARRETPASVAGRSPSSTGSSPVPGPASPAPAGVRRRRSPPGGLAPGSQRSVVIKRKRGGGVGRAPRRRRRRRRWRPSRRSRWPGHRPAATRDRVPWPSRGAACPGPDS